MKRFLVILFLLGSFCFGQELQKYEPPDGRIIHGLGQYEGFFYDDSVIWQDIKNYQAAVGEAPVIYSVYASIDPVNVMFDPTDFNDIVSSHDYPYLLLVGILLHDSQYLINGTFNVHVESILNGSLDSQIESLAQRIKAVDAPVFVRPGFEFGVNNSGFHNDPDLDAEKFKSIWIYIYNVFAGQQVDNVAWVWNTVNPSNFDYMTWYPGDAYVDWWGINYFTSGQISGSDDFIADAEAHNKPVMVCESAPITSSGTLNSSNWQNWFVPYFNKIESKQQLKAFVYINSPWTVGPFSDWPESRITENKTIADNYKQQLTDSMYIHMDEYMSDPALITSIKKTAEMPLSYDMKFSNYPNPFNSQTRISWLGYSPEAATVDIFNVMGKKITSFRIKNMHRGKNEITWNAKKLSSGIYYGRITTASGAQAYTKMSLIK